MSLLPYGYLLTKTYDSLNFLLEEKYQLFYSFFALKKI